MNPSLIPFLIRKDLQMTWPISLVATLAGLGALVLWKFGNEGLAIGGIVAFFIVLVMLGILPMTMIMNERKKQTLAFIMSLPVTAAQYGIAKLAAAFSMFVIPWLMLIGIALILIINRNDIPNGLMPLAFVLMLLPLVGFLLMTSVAIVSESEAKSVFTMGAVNVSYSFVWIAITMTPGLTRDIGSAVPVWNETVLTVLGGELAVIVAIVALTLFLQSRKRDFV
jgi:ABC-type transport system involved in multi-copper enzyme maturation permease subunit